MKKIKTFCMLKKINEEGLTVDKKKLNEWRSLMKN